MKHALDQEGALDRGVAVDSGPSTVRAGALVVAPGLNGHFVDPDGQAPTADQRSVVFRPVADPVPEDEVGLAHPPILAGVQT